MHRTHGISVLQLWVCHQAAGARALVLLSASNRKTSLERQREVSLYQHGDLQQHCDSSPFHSFIGSLKVMVRTCAEEITTEEKSHYHAETINGVQRCSIPVHFPQEPAHVHCNANTLMRALRIVILCDFIFSSMSRKLWQIAIANRKALKFPTAYDARNDHDSRIK